MPRVISDELYEDLISNIAQQRLLGIMGKLERLRDEAKYVSQLPSLDVPVDGGIGEYEVFAGKGVFKLETKTNNN